MRLSKPISRLARALFATVRTVVIELISILREMARIPAGLFMRVAESAGALVLAGWLFVWPLLQTAYRAAARGLAWAERELTPARAVVAVAAFVAVALALSQFAAYTTTTIGTADYSEVAAVAPAPPVDTADAGTAHAWLGIPLGLLALGIVARAATGRWQVARLLIGVGLAVVVMTLAIDMPKGLDEGDAAVAYEGASAELLGGFWAQLVCGVLLIALAPLLTRLLEPGARARADAAPRRVQPLRLALPGNLRMPKLPGGRIRLGRQAREARS